ncbi:MAG: hypothetical protein AAB495_03275 [Patescibacteria group bacterium]
MKGPGHPAKGAEMRSKGAFLILLAVAILGAACAEKPRSADFVTARVLAMDQGYALENTWIETMYKGGRWVVVVSGVAVNVARIDGRDIYWARTNTCLAPVPVRRETFKCNPSRLARMP